VPNLVVFNNLLTIKTQTNLLKFGKSTIATRKITIAIRGRG
jgi:hypothetical protein